MEGSGIIIMFSLVLLALKQLMACKNRNECYTVYSNSNLKPSKLQDHFIKRYGRADVSGHDFESMKYYIFN